jgi:hypothetical protein
MLLLGAPGLLLMGFWCSCVGLKVRYLGVAASYHDGAELPGQHN